jgi:hypothetical protein
VNAYATAQPIYTAVGWTDVLPLPPREKADPPSGYTGKKHAGVSLTATMLEKWATTQADGNIALRLPPGILAIDVDAYGDRPGAETLAKLEAQAGPLPATWISSSRDDGVSGIRLFKVPDGLAWRTSRGST